MIDHTLLRNVAEIIDPAAFLPSRRDPDHIGASNALEKAKKIIDYLNTQPWAASQ